MVTGCCTLIFLQLWSSQSPTAFFLCSAILLVYLFQQIWGFIPFFLCFHAATCCKILCQSGMCRPSLALTRCCGSLRAQAVLGLLSCSAMGAAPLAAAALGPLPCGFQRESHTSLLSTSSNPLCFHTETQSLFQGMKPVQKW